VLRIPISHLRRCGAARYNVGMALPPYWKRLRILAYPVRLEMLSLVASRPGHCVKDIGEQMALAEDVASKHLQQLAEGGFLIAERDGRFLYYSVSRDRLAQGCLDEMKRECADIGSMMYAFTAFTHERRIAIVKHLCSEPQAAEQLGVKTGISQGALLRHLDKLSRRGVVERNEDKWVLKKQRRGLARLLLELALA